MCKLRRIAKIHKNIINSFYEGEDCKVYNNNNNKKFNQFIDFCNDFCNDVRFLPDC